MFQRQIGFNRKLDLMEREAEFTPLTRWLSCTEECIHRGKYRNQFESVPEQAGRPAVSRVAKPKG
jgi:hypothetical protein